jgi:hypothetical protein
VTTLAGGVTKAKAEVARLQEWIDIFKRVEADKLAEADSRLAAMTALRDAALNQAEVREAEHAGGWGCAEGVCVEGEGGT